MSAHNAMEPRSRTLSPPKLGALILSSAATILLVPLEWYATGAAVWLAAVVVVWRISDPIARRTLALLLVLVAILAVSPIDTRLDTRHFVTLGVPFFVVVFGPYLFMRWKMPGAGNWVLWPRRFSGWDLFYTLIAIPLAWGVIELYFFHLNPELPTHWPLPAVYDAGQVHRLILGINGVGIWDELFFVNTVYVLLRGTYRPWVANLGQAVVYTSVLYDMAFTGWGVVIVFLFALTQGRMYERSRVLFYVLIVHIIVDVFLVLAIFQYHYPDRGLVLF